MAKKKVVEYRRFIRVNGKVIPSPRFARKADADAWYDEMKRKKGFVKHGFQAPGDDKLTFHEFAIEWFQKRMKNYPASTWTSDEQRLRDYCLPKLGELPISSITPNQCRKLLTDMTDNGLAIATRTKVKALLSKMFNDALNDSPPKVKFNPVAGMKFAGARQGKKTPSHLETTADVLAFMKRAKAQGPRYYVYAALGLMAGLRKSEMIGLQWRDVLWDESKVHVCRHVEQVSKTIKPGTKGGKDETRKVDVPPDLIRILSEHRKKSRFSGEADFVLCTKAGKWISPRNLSDMQNRLLSGFGKHVTIHGLRHTYGREFAARTGNLKALQALLGHASSTTTDLYSELKGDRLRPFAAVMNFETEESNGDTDKEVTP